MSSDAIIVHPSSAVTTMENAPATVLAEAQKAATALKDVIARKAKPVIINGEQYIEAPDWQLIGKFYGYTSGLEHEPEYVELNEAHGFKATAVAIDRSGVVRSRATAYCMDDEQRWDKAPTFQLCSMAQTRANAKVLRNVLGWVVELAGYKPTPAEEMDGVQPHRNGTSAAPATGPVPECPKCHTHKHVMPSKYAKNGVRPWYCMDCKTKWGNAEAPPADEWDGEPEA